MGVTLKFRKSKILIAEINHKIYLWDQETDTFGVGDTYSEALMELGKNHNGTEK